MGAHVTTSQRQSVSDIEVGISARIPPDATHEPLEKLGQCGLLRVDEAGQWTSLNYCARDEVIAKTFDLYDKRL